MSLLYSNADFLGVKFVVGIVVFCVVGSEFDDGSLLFAVLTRQVKWKAIFTDRTAQEERIGGDMQLAEMCEAVFHLLGVWIPFFCDSDDLVQSIISDGLPGL
ncbi:MAG: hypothetical protein IPK53_11170 [bacterium]|nr:hypothetical protein [bacterium]